MYRLSLELRPLSHPAAITAASKSGLFGNPLLLALVGLVVLLVILFVVHRVTGARADRDVTDDSKTPPESLPAARLEALDAAPEIYRPATTYEPPAPQASPEPAAADAAYVPEQWAPAPGPELFEVPAMHEAEMYSPPDAFGTPFAPAPPPATDPYATVSPFELPPPAMAPPPVAEPEPVAAVEPSSPTSAPALTPWGPKPAPEEPPAEQPPSAAAPPASPPVAAVAPAESELPTWRPKTLPDPVPPDLSTARMQPPPPPPPPPAPVVEPPPVPAAEPTAAPPPPFELAPPVADAAPAIDMSPAADRPSTLDSLPGLHDMQAELAGNDAGLPPADLPAAAPDPTELAPLEIPPFEPGQPVSAEVPAATAEAPIAGDLAAAAGVAGTPVIAAATAEDGSQKLILLIEDDERIAKFYTILFQAKGFAVENARDGVEGVDMATALKPALILLDVMMPKMNGLMVLQTLRANPETEKTPVVVLSNYMEPPLIQRALQLGAIEYVVKSQARPEQLVNALPQWLEGKPAIH